MPKIPFDDVLCRMAAMSIMNSTKCQELRSRSTLCVGCPGYVVLLEVTTMVEVETAKEMDVTREEIARLTTSYKVYTPEEQPPGPLSPSAGNISAKAKGQSRTKGGPDIYCRGCGRNNIPIRTRDDLCSRCSKRRRLGLPLATEVEIRRGIKCNVTKVVGV